MIIVRQHPSNVSPPVSRLRKQKGKINRNDPCYDDKNVIKTLTLNTTLIKLSVYFHEAKLALPWAYHCLFMLMVLMVKEISNEPEAYDGQITKDGRQWKVKRGLNCSSGESILVQLDRIKRSEFHFILWSREKKLLSSQQNPIQTSSCNDLLPRHLIRMRMNSSIGACWLQES